MFSVNPDRLRERGAALPRQGAGDVHHVLPGAEHHRRRRRFTSKRDAFHHAKAMEMYKGF